jgi:hypothetical protein
MRRPAREFAELWISRSVRQKLESKHRLEAWEVEQAIFDDPDRFVQQIGDLYAVYGRSFAGRYLLCLVRQLRPDEITGWTGDPSVKVLRLITARDMDEAQRRRYRAQRGHRP